VPSQISRAAVLVSAAIILLALIAALQPSDVQAAAERGRYIVVFEDWVDNPGNLARKQAQQQNGKLGFVYRHVLRGYSAELPSQAVEGLRRNPQVKYITIDGMAAPVEEMIETIDHEGVELFEHTIPTGISRTFATANKTLDIDGFDDLRIDVDVAVIDTGTSHAHTDLNVVAHTDCSSGTEKEAACINESGTDLNGHGTHVAGTIGAIDNGIGVVGMAPGARIWAVKVLGTGTNYFSEIIAGVDWITAKRKDESPGNDIEVANMSLGCSSFSPFCPPKPLDEAITKSVEAGVVHVVAAGNSSLDGKNFTPANSPNVITVSALADYDGKAEGKGSATCGNYGLDDRLASFSNFGATVEVVAPGTCILSTTPSGYGLKSGTSMASPHVAGAAAILAARDKPESKADVEAIGKTIKEEGNLNWTDTSGDGINEPLLDVSDEAVFKLIGPPVVSTEPSTSASATGGTLNGTVNPKGAATTYRFQYGPNTFLLTSIPIPSESVGSGTAAVAVSKAITGLSRETVYYYRVVAESSEGITYGAFRTFSTLAMEPSQLSYTGSGKSGSGPGEFEYPEGIAVDQSGNVWVSDRPTDRIERFDEKGAYVSQFGVSGSGNGQLDAPAGIAIYGSDLWVVDTGNCRIQKFNNKGEYLAQFGSCGSGNGQFTSPWGIAIAPDGTIWVSDIGSDRIQKFTSSGVYVTQIGTSGNGDGQFADPRGLAVDASHNVWVADEHNHRLQQFSPAGAFLAKFGTKGSGDGSFDEPTGVAVMASGNLLVADGYNNHRVQQLSSKGHFQAKFKGNMWTPTGIARGRGGKLFIVDRANRGFYRWSQPMKPEATTASATNVKTTEATLNGTVTPSGETTTYQFQYGKNFLSMTSVPVPGESAGSGTEPVTVSRTISGLSPGTTYQYRVIAENSYGMVQGSYKSFTP
jgi:subtilisin family serine protease